MSPSENQPENATAVNVDLNFNDTELTLGLPGAANKAGSKRGFSLTLESSSNNVHTLTSPKSPPHKEQVVGWPPVRASRKSAMKKICKYVKVAVDGAPYLRKVDLEMYQSYDQLLTSLETMFTCLTIRYDMSEKKYESGKNNNGGEYVPTYEDKDGDWMMVGDVPWNMFVESCKRIRLMMSCDGEDTTGLGSRTTSDRT